MPGFSMSSTDAIVAIALCMTVITVIALRRAPDTQQADVLRALAQVAGCVASVLLAARYLM